MKNKNKLLFYIFLFINAFLWTFLQCFRNMIGNDALEAISWGELLSAGTNKHPPMSGWLMGGTYHLFGQHDIAAYFLGQVCILIGFIFLYKLAKFFMSEEKAMCSTLIMSSCYYYTYVAFYENFNCNFLSMALWPMIAYFYYKSIKTEKTGDWILFGLCSGLGVLTKYQVIFLFLALFVHLILCERKQFKRIGMYAAILTGFIIILPHIIWLVQNDFFSFIYMAGRTEVGIHNTPQSLVRFGRIVFPVKFCLDQILSVASCFAMYLILAWYSKNIKIGSEKNDLSEKIFIVSVSCLPILLQGFMGFVTNTRVQGMWGSMMVGFAGILFFCFLPVKFKDETFKFCLKMAYLGMIIWLAAMTIFLNLQTKFHMSFPHQTIVPDLNNKWAVQTGNAPLKYVGGHIDYVFKFKTYNPDYPCVILETFGHENPWINHKDVIKSGAIIFGNSSENAVDMTKELILLLPEDYKIVPESYKFKIKNKAGKTKEFEFFYVIIPPAKE